ncbi:11809_t:CDS:2 [Scutellospora calospora]|uniref:11809_t:CDS:1 n=1 Tax=Scutellospora calospora TaxID=85575 RepID=A0ACA9JY68_9GLOM|nr:11809_t:CDS:2 [Scutellospora calospora]
MSSGFEGKKNNEINDYEVLDNDQNNEMNIYEDNEMSEESNGDALETFDPDNAIEKHVLRVSKIHEVSFRASSITPNFRGSFSFLITVLFKLITGT